jgi:hypothetical protein
MALAVPGPPGCAPSVDLLAQPLEVVLAHLGVGARLAESGRLDYCRCGGATGTEVAGLDEHARAPGRHASKELHATAQAGDDCYYGQIVDGIDRSSPAARSATLPSRKADPE